jgi:Mg2+ and Co2+ transporter CorA
MEAILKYNLDDFDDRKAHLRCIKSLDMACVIFEFLRNSRKKLRNEDKFTVDDVFDHFHTLLEENNINIDELID